AVPIGGEAEANQAIEAAHHAFGPWSGLTAYERTAYLKRFNDLILENQEELAQIMTLEMGKPINDSRREDKYAASFIECLAEEGIRIYAVTIPSLVNGSRLQV